MTNEARYKNIAIVLAIVAIVFAVLFFTKGNDKVSDTLEDVSNKLTECKDNIAEWQSKHSTATASDDAQKELSDILEDCNTAVEAGAGQI